METGTDCSWRFAMFIIPKIISRFHAYVVFVALIVDDGVKEVSEKNVIL